MAKKSTVINKAREDFESQLEREVNGAIKLKMTVSWERIEEVFHKVMNVFIAEVELPGFRKGKVPREKAEAQIDKTKVYEKVVQEILPFAYKKAVETHKIKPVIYPDFGVEKAKEGEDWVFNALTCESPVVELGEYVEKIKQKVGNKRPKETKEALKDEEKDEWEQKVLETLLEVVSVEIPDLLIKAEANHRLSQLIAKTERLGVSMPAYLNSIKKTEEELKAEYAKEARRAIETEVVLNEIFVKEGLKVSDKEVDKIIEVSGDEKIRQQLSDSPEQRAAIRRMLSRRAAFNFVLASI